MVMKFIGDTYDNVTGVMSGIGDSIVSLTPAHKRKLKKQEEELERMRNRKKTVGLKQPEYLEMIDPTSKQFLTGGNVRRAADEKGMLTTKDGKKVPHIIAKPELIAETTGLKTEETLQQDATDYSVEEKGGDWAGALASALSYMGKPKDNPARSNVGGSFNSAAYFGALQHNPFKGLGGGIK